MNFAMIPNLRLEAMAKANPQDAAIQAALSARMAALRIPTFTESSGKEGWYE